MEARDRGNGARLPAPERRAMLMRAAGRRFARHGYAGTRLDDIAADALVTKPVLYRHFPSKKALYMALLNRHRDDLSSFFEPLPTSPSAPAPEHVVRSILDLWLDYVKENQHAWHMLFRDSSGDGEITELRRAVSLRARDVMAAFIARQAGPGIPPEQLEPSAEMLVSALKGLALWWIDNPTTPKEMLVDVGMRACDPLLVSGRPQRRSPATSSRSRS